MKRFVKQWNELLALPIAVLIYFGSPWVYRLFDATAGAFDAGYLHKLSLSVVFLLVASAVSWLLYRLNFPTLYRYFDDDMEDELLLEIDDHKKGLICERVKYSFLVYFLYFAAMVLFLVAI